MSADKKTLAAYAERVDDYLSLTHKDGPDKDLKAFIAALPKGAHVLDLGCGPGKSASAMSKVGFQVTATDASPEMVAVAREKFAVNAQLQSFSELAATNTYDGVFANFSLLHARISDFPGHLNRVKQALKPGGLLHLGMKTGSGERRDSLGRHYAYYSEDELITYLTTADFHDILVTRIGDSPGLAGQTEPFVILWARA